MRILTYKRTHIGDPDHSGRFGIFDCMGRVRSYGYDAVIGIGGIGREPCRFGIDRKLNWVGIGPTRGRNGVVTFYHFSLFEEQGPLFAELAPTLAKRMYDRNVRILIHSYTDREKAEAENILHWLHGRRAQRFNGTGKQSNRLDCHSRCTPAAKASRC